MILILSRESAEITTDVVMDWLDYYRVKYFRLNGEDLVNGKCVLNFEICKKKKEWSFTIHYNGQVFHSDSINSVWFRRSFDWDIEQRYWQTPSNIDEYAFLKEFNNYHQREIRTVYNLIEQVLEDRYWLNRPSKSDSDKFRTLSIAIKNGFSIPETIITNNVKGLEQFIQKNKSCITKPSKEGTLITATDFGICTMTNKVTLDTVLELPTSYFAPSFFQKEIDKEYELRVIYLENQIFTVGIFSQINEKTKVDYRNYDKEKPNRLQLINLPEQITNNIKSLMQDIELNFGSLDIIKDTNGGYYFLEINPIGQFLGISNILGLHIEKRIAKILKQKNELKRI